MEVCRFFAQGRCAFGTACRLVHEQPVGAGPAPPPRRQPPPQAPPPPPQQEVWSGYDEQAWEQEEAVGDTREAEMKEKRKIDKAMREIEALEERLNRGERLQNNQLKKLEKKQEYTQRLVVLEELLSRQPEPVEAPPVPAQWASQGYAPPPPSSSQSRAGPPAPVCRHFLAGRCSFGSACQNSHFVEDRALQCGPPQRKKLEPSFDPEDPECGICFESIRKKGERFGILESCDHAFCLTCIRSWRKQREQQDRQNLRLCPVCRNESYFVIPCDDIFLDPDEKLRVIQAYKNELGRIPCRAFDYGKGKCPFGTSCFYAHLNPDGTRYVPPALRWRCGADGNEVINEVKLSDHLSRALLL